LDFNRTERAVLESFRGAPSTTDRSWLLIVSLGALVCVLALVMFFFTDATLSFSLLSLVAGLVVMSRGLERRRRAILARIIRKYDEAMAARSEIKTAQTEILEERDR
jgi:hypothetical protein